MKANYSKDNLEKLVKESFSFAQVIRKLGLRDVGSNFSTIKKYVIKYNIDVSHFTGQRWNAGKTEKDNENISIIKLDDIINNRIPIKSYNLKQKLFNLGIKEQKCECCGITEWNGKKIMFELHHIDGNHYNNNLSNLQILCPNCHSQTSTYRSSTKKNIKPDYEKIYQHKLNVKTCLECGKEFIPHKKTTKFCCLDCYKQYRKK